MIAFVKRYRLALTLVAIVAVIVFALMTTFGVVDRLREEEIDRQVSSCQSSAEFRREFPSILRAVVDAASSGEPVDLTSLPQFEALDQSTKDFVAALSVALASAPDARPDIDAVLDDYERQFPVPDCEALEAKLRDRLG